MPVRCGAVSVPPEARRPGRGAAPSSGARLAQRWRVCALPAAALTPVPGRLCSRTGLLAGCRPGTRPEMPDPPSLWFSNCRKVH